MASIPYANLQAVAAKALKGGGVQGVSNALLTEWEWTISGGCTDPIPRTLAAYDPDRDHLLRVHLNARCRRCAPCLRFRAITWRDRVFNELATSERTWFTTLTFTLMQQYAFDLAIAKEYERCGHSFPKGKRLYEERCKQAGLLVTKFIKRLRSDIGEKSLRYVAVAEPHKSGLPHFHVMLHETNGPIGLRDIMAAWYQMNIPANLPRYWYSDAFSFGQTQAGLMSCKLVATGDEASCQRSSWYICKYLTKEAGIRMRASFRYGAVSDGPHHNLTSNIPTLKNGGVTGGVSPPLHVGMSENKVGTTTTYADEVGCGQTVPFATVTQRSNCNGGLERVSDGIQESGARLSTATALKPREEFASGGERQRDAASERQRYAPVYLEQLHDWFASGVAPCRYYYRHPSGLGGGPRGSYNCQSVKRSGPAAARL